MKTTYVRIFALILVASLLSVGMFSLLPRPWMTIDDGIIEEPEDIVMGPNPPIYRGTRSPFEWPQHRNDLPNTGFGTSPVPDTNAVLWSNNTGGSGEAYGSPSIADGRVFIGSVDGYLYCFDLDNGDRLWRILLSAADFGVVSTPAVYDDHVYVFSSGDDAIYSLWTSNGTIDWSWDPGGGAYGGSSPALTDDSIYYGSGNRYLYRLNRTTGSLIWSYQTDTAAIRNYGIQSSPAVANGRVFVGACDTYLYCFNEFQPTAPSANYLWRTSLADAVFGSPAVANGRVYAGSGYYNYGEGSGTHTMFCLDELTGGVIWSYLTGSDILSSPAIAYGNCYFTSADGSLYCVDAMSGGPTTTLYWSNTTTDTWSSPAVSAGRVVVGSRGSNRVYCYNATDGTLVWDYAAGDDIYNSPAIADGKVVVGVGGSPESVVCFGFFIPPTVDYIEILDGPGGAGSPIANQTIGVGTIIPGYAAAFNSSSGYMYDIQVDWSVINGGGANASTFPLNSVTTSDFNSGYNGGTATWTADDGDGHSDTISFIIDSPIRDYIEIVDTQNTGMFPITDQPVGVGFSISGYAAAFNNSIGYLGDISVDWTVTNLSGAAAYTIPPSGTDSTFYANFSGGIGVWTANDGAGHEDSVTFTINPPQVDSIDIVNTPGMGVTAITGQIVNVGFSIQGYAASFNDTVGYLGDISVNWYVVNSSGAEGSTSPGSGADSILDVGLSGGTVEWWADDGAGHQDSVTYTVNPPGIDYIVVMSGPNGTGSWVGGATYTYGEDAPFYAAGYNNTAGWVTDVDVTWSTDNSSVGDVTAGPSNSTTFTAQNNGTCNITATYNVIPALTNTTGVITVVYFSVEYIIIRSAPGNGGSPVTDMVFGVGQNATFYAAAYNSSAPGEYIGDVAVEWSVNDTSLGTVTTPGISTLFTAHFIGGICNVSAKYKSSIEDVTGNLTIRSARLDYILITEIPGGPEVMDIVLNIGEFIWFNASGYNATGPTYIGPFSVEWSQSPTVLGSFSTPSGQSTTFTAGTTGGSTTIWAIYDPSGRNLTVNFTLSVNEPSVDYILIRDDDNGAGDVVTSRTYVELDTDTFYAAAYNNTAGYLFDANVAWSCNDTVVGQVTTPGTSTSFSALDVTMEGICFVTATYNALIGNQTGTLTVLPVNVDYIQIRDASGGGGEVVDTGIYGVWETDTFFAAAYSDLTGYLYDISVTWLSGDTSAGQVTTIGSSTIFTAQIVDVNSTFNITARYSDSIVNTTGPLTVLIRTVDYIQIRDADNNVVSSIELELREWGDLYAIGFNNTAGYMGYVDVSWSIADGIGSFNPVHDHLTNLTATARGTSTLTAFYNLDVSNSTQVTVTTRISAPTGVGIAQVPQGGALNITWNENPEENLAGYDIYISLSPTGSFTKKNSVLITTTRFTDVGLANGIRYYYYIVAVDTSGVSSDPSEIESGIPDRDTDNDGTYNFIDDDDDNDGLPDASEALLNTDPLVADTDGDGTIDGEDYFPTDDTRWQKPSEREDEGSFLWILIPIIVLIVLFLLFFLITRRQGPQEPAPPPEPEEELPPPPEALAEEELPPPPEDFEQPAPDEEELPPPPDDEELPPPPEDEEIPLPPEEEELPAPPEEEKSSPPPEEEEMPPPPEEEELPAPPPWFKKKAQLVPFDEDELPPPDD